MPFGTVPTIRTAQENHSVTPGKIHSLLKAVDKLDVHVEDDAEVAGLLVVVAVVVEVTEEAVVDPVHGGQFGAVWVVPQHDPP